jgi:fructosamine-3-kinase
MTLDHAEAEHLAQILGARIERATALGGGCVADVQRLDLADGRTVVMKRGSGLELEAWMLRWLKQHSPAPVPKVHHAAPDLLVMDFVDGESGRLSADAEAHLGEIVAALHGVTGDAFGFERDTVIGGLKQPNPRQAMWHVFFRDHRLLHMARAALTAKRLPASTMNRIETLAAELDRWIDETSAPTLIHGDLWGGNIMSRGGRVTGLIDPAIHFADPEIELAFMTLFGSVGDRFFASYGERRPIRPGFFEARRDLYNLYPLLVHVRLFGGSYVAQVERTLDRFGV